MIFAQPFLLLAVFMAAVNSQSLTVVNSCTEDVLLFTQTSDGTVDQDVALAAGATTDLGISSDWDGAVNVGEHMLIILYYMNIRY